MQEKSARPYHHGDLKRVVIETAQDMLREDKGWQFTLREVARRAGVSHAAPYKHFPDKARCWPSWRRSASISFARLSTLSRRPKRLRHASFSYHRRGYVDFRVANPPSTG